MKQKQNSQHYLYPLWLRIWHWINAACFLILIFTGIFMHYSLEPVAFETSRFLHNTSGILLSIAYLFYIIMNIISGNYRQYIPPKKDFMKNLIIQARYYGYGIFKGEDHPFHTTEESKFNPLQRITYLFIMYIFMPLVILTGILLFFPEAAPDNVLGAGGIWPVAIAHTAVGYILSYFMVAHIYLATHGPTVSANFKSMIDGYHRSDED